MQVFLYDKTFEGLLTAVFDAYSRRSFPDKLLDEKEAVPSLFEEPYIVCTEEMKADRVWNGLGKRLSRTAFHGIFAVWLSEQPGVDILLFRYICKVIDSTKSVELNFGDPDILAYSKILKKVVQESHYVMQFLRFQQTKDGVYFAAVEPLYNVLPLVISHLEDRFASQSWMVYDMKREYGFYYDKQSVSEVSFSSEKAFGEDGNLKADLMSEDEQLIQRVWQTYFKSIAIEARRNPRLHRQNMPRRFWKYLIEKKEFRG